MTGPCSGLASHPPHHPGMDRRRFLLTSLAGALAAPLAGEAQQVSALRIVGILTSRPQRALPLEEGLRDLGWVEGKTIRFERRFTIDYQEMPRLGARAVLRLMTSSKLEGCSTGRSAGLAPLRILST